MLSSSKFSSMPAPFSAALENRSLRSTSDIRSRVLAEVISLWKLNHCRCAIPTFLKGRSASSRARKRLTQSIDIIFMYCSSSGIFHLSMGTIRESTEKLSMCRWVIGTMRKSIFFKNSGLMPMRSYLSISHSPPKRNSMPEAFGRGRLCDMYAEFCFEYPLPSIL